MNTILRLNDRKKLLQDSQETVFTYLLVYDTTHNKIIVLRLLFDGNMLLATATKYLPEHCTEMYKSWHGVL